MPSGEGFGYHLPAGRLTGDYGEKCREHDLKERRLHRACVKIATRTKANARRKRIAAQVRHILLVRETLFI